MNLSKFLNIANQIQPGAQVTVMYGAPMELASTAKDTGVYRDDGSPFYPIPPEGYKGKQSKMDLTDPQGEPVSITKYSTIHGQFGVDYNNTAQVIAAREAGYDPETRTYKNTTNLNKSGTVFDYGGNATICLYKAPGTKFYGEHKYVVHDIFGDTYTVDDLSDAEDIYLKKSNKNRSDYEEMQAAKERDKEPMPYDGAQKKIEIQGWMRLLVDRIYGVFYGGALITEDMSQSQINEAMERANTYIANKNLVEKSLISKGYRKLAEDLNYGSMRNWGIIKTSSIRSRKGLKESYRIRKRDRR